LYYLASKRLTSAISAISKGRRRSSIFNLQSSIFNLQCLFEPTLRSSCNTDAASPECLSVLPGTAIEQSHTDIKSPWGYFCPQNQISEPYSVLVHSIVQVIPCTEYFKTPGIQKTPFCDCAQKHASGPSMTTKTIHYLILLETLQGDIAKSFF
jgi:hypothetical protein